MFVATRVVLPLILAATLSAQDAPPTVQDLAGQSHQLVQQLKQMSQVDGPTAEQRAAYADTLQALEQLAARVAKLEGLTVEHYVEVGSPMLQHFAPQGLVVTDAGLKHFPDSRFLWDHKGFAHTKIADDLKPCAARVVAWRAAEQAFRKALALPSDTFHAHLGLYQVLSPLDQCAEALEQFELGVKDEAGKAAVHGAWLARASLLLRLGRSKEAATLLAGADVAEDARDEVRIMTLRAHALGGDATAAQTVIKAMRDAEPGLRSLIEAADALAYLGKKQDALKLLAQRPPLGKWESEEERIAQILSASAGAMEVFWKATDFTPKGPLRLALTKALDHHVMVMDPAAKGGPKETDLSSSPLLMCNLLASAPATPEKDWANRVLQVLCVRALPDHKPAAFEKQVAGYLKTQRFVTADDLPAVMLAMREAVGDPDACGVLTGLRALEKLGDKKVVPVPAKK